MTAGWIRNAVTLSLFGLSAHGADLGVAVRVVNRAGVPDATMEEAKQEGTRIFGKAGIAIQWVDCPAGAPRDPTCEQEPSPRELVLRIVSGSNLSNSGHYFGSAFVSEDGRFGHYATVYYGGVRALSNGEAKLEGRLLGYTITHEIGHLLLGANNHASTGIMMARWGEKALRNAPKDSFLFPPGQAARLQELVLARVRASE